MKRIKKLLEQPQSHLLLFCLGLVFFNWPILGILHPEGSDGMFVYLFLNWIIAIFLLFLISRSCKNSTSSVKEKEEGDGDV